MPPLPFRLPGRETKIFDPADGFGSIVNVTTVADPTVVKRGAQWWMYLAGQVLQDPSIHLFSACLPAGAPLSATGWTIVGSSVQSDHAAILADQEGTRAWDYSGGRHCPAYVRGWDPSPECWVERIYYAGSSAAAWGPYAISYIEWDGAHWVAQPEPVFLATEAWERGSVYEPNVVYSDGKWKLWYLAGSNYQNYLAPGYAESVDGRSNWTRPTPFASPEEKIFDFCPIKTSQGCEAVWARVWLAAGDPPANVGLWWSRVPQLGASIESWSDPVQIMGSENRGWHAGPWKPSAVYSESGKLFVFFNGAYPKPAATGLPVEFTVGCVEL